MPTVRANTPSRNWWVDDPHGLLQPALVTRSVVTPCTRAPRRTLHIFSSEASLRLGSS